MNETCPYGHEIRSSADRDAQGYCRECKRRRERARRHKARAQIELARCELDQMRSIAAQLANHADKADQQIAESLYKIADELTSNLLPVAH